MEMSETVAIWLVIHRGVQQINTKVERELFEW